MKIQMQVVSGAKAAKVTLRLPTIIGRARDARLKLRDSKVSRHHCELYEYEGQLAVRDLGSSNGTIVNGYRIEDPVLIGTEDTLTVGPVTFRPLIHPIDPAEADTDIQEAAVAPVRLPDQPAEEESVDSEPSSEMEPPTSSDATHEVPRKSESEIDYDETDEGSFLGIRTVEGVPATPAVEPSESVDLAGDGVPDASPVDPQDSNLGEFLKGFE